MLFSLIITVFFGMSTLYLYLINRNRKHFPPGPFNLPIIGGLYELGKDPHKKLLQLKKKYGKIIGVSFGGYRGIVLNDYHVMKEALDIPEFNNRAKFEIIQHCRGINVPGVTYATGESWSEQRRFLFKQLGNFGVGKKSMEALILDQLNRLRDDLDKQLEIPVVNTQLFNAAAMGSLWAIINGKISQEHDDDFKQMVRSIDTVFAGAPVGGPIYFFPRLSQLFPQKSGWNSYVRAHEWQCKFVNKLIESHEEKFQFGENPEDYIEAFLEKIANTSDKKSTFHEETGKNHLMITVIDLFRAGTETVALTLTWFVLLMILHPEVQEKLQKEIDRVIGKFALPSLEDRDKMPYVEACVHELLRYTTVASLAIPHETSGDVHFKGFFIPKGTIVILNLYGVLHDPELWQDPDDFKPERFLSSDGLSVLRNTPANLAFGTGKRVCPGEALARNEIFLFLTGLIQRYTFSADPNSSPPVLESRLGLTLVPKPHSMIISKRN